MNSFVSILTGLLSSFLLSLGLAGLAARFDGLDQVSTLHSVQPGDRLSASFSISPCKWQEI